MTTARWLAAVILAAAASSGCGGSDDDDDGDSPSVEAQVEEQLAPYEAALDEPDGTVNAENARAVLLNAGSQESVSQFAGFVPAGSTRASQPREGDPSACISAGPSGGTIDLACLTDGAMTGTERYWVEVDGSSYMYMLIELIDACADATCVDGHLAMEMHSDTAAQEYTLVAGGEFDITTAGGQVAHLEYGYRMIISGGTTTVEAAYFDAHGGSYTLDAMDPGDSGTVIMTGSNGSYTCSYTEGGEHGQCQPVGGGEGFAW